MFFNKNDHLLGLDIGSRAIKVSEIVKKGPDYGLKKICMTDIEPGMLEEGEILKHEELSEAILTLFQSNKIQGKNVAASIDDRSVITEKISLQKMDENDLIKAVAIEAEQYIPYDIKDVYLDYHILGENKNNQVDILLVAVKKEIIDDYHYLISLSGLNPFVIDVDSFALQNIFEFNYNLGDQNIVLIDIGAGKTSLSFIKGNYPLFKRDLPMGCSHVYQDITRSMEETRQNDSDPFSETEEISLAIQWCEEVTRALDFFSSRYPNDKSPGIILSGGGANIPNFRELLIDQVSSNIEIINPFKNIIVDKRYFDPAYIESIAPQAAISLGLALRRRDDK